MLLFASVLFLDFVTVVAKQNCDLLIFVVMFYNINIEHLKSKGINIH